MSAYHGVGLDSVSKSCSSGNVSCMIEGSLSEFMIKRDKWSATVFFDPFLSLISKLNSCNSKIHRISQAFASFLVRRKRRAT